MTVRQLLSSMDAYEILEWQAYMQLDEERRENKQSPEVVGENLRIALEGL